MDPVLQEHMDALSDLKFWPDENCSGHAAEVLRNALFEVLRRLQEQAVLVGTPA